MEKSIEDSIDFSAKRRGEKLFGFSASDNHYGQEAVRCTAI